MTVIEPDTAPRAGGRAAPRAAPLTDAAPAHGIAEVAVEIPAVVADALLLVPTGTEGPHEAVAGVAVEGGAVERHVAASGLGLGALVVRPTAPRMTVRYTIGPSAAPVYPEAAFHPRRTRHTVAADDLATAARAIADRAGHPRAAIEALVAEAEARFAYDHPEVRFTDGHDAVPYLSCGLTPGSCVDINTYLVAALRAAGLEAGYLYGYFFPAEKGGGTHDMHCWVVTRAAGEVLEWDIAHHIKAGLGPTRPGLNPRPGRRVLIGHSMGHRYALPGAALDLKLLAEPVWVLGGAARPVEGLRIVAT